MAFTFFDCPPPPEPTTGAVPRSLDEDAIHTVSSMKQKEFIDYYEVLEVSSNADSRTIERVFRYLAQQCHPDVASKSDPERFNLLVDAYNALKDPMARTAYDAEHKKHQQYKMDIISGANAADSDCADRHRLLTIFYSQRRRDFKNPGVGIYTLEQIMGCPMEVLEFHLWYFREKGWVQREESGLMSITAMGVDEIERNAEKRDYHDGYIEDKSLCDPDKPNSKPTLVEDAASV